ncbi:MAG: hypothetical protein H5U20_12095 [Rhodobacteraceae bacterium]|nr:hypothetical protein [Paracoccaceae bacterium]
MARVGLAGAGLIGCRHAEALAAAEGLVNRRVIAAIRALAASGQTVAPDAG